VMPLAVADILHFRSRRGSGVVPAGMQISAGDRDWEARGSPGLIQIMTGVSQTLVARVGLGSRQGQKA
jgi:hypothetical protein